MNNSIIEVNDQSIHSFTDCTFRLPSIMQSFILYYINYSNNTVGSHCEAVYVSNSNDCCFSVDCGKLFLDTSHEMSFYIQSIEPAFISESDSIYFFKRYEYCKMKYTKELPYYPLSTIVYDLTSTSTKRLLLPHYTFTQPGSYYDYSPQEYTINGKEKIREIFYYFDRNCSNKLELKEIQRFIHKLSIKLPLDANELKEALILMDIEVENDSENENNYSMTFDQFIVLYKRLGQSQFNEHIIKLSLNYLNHYPLYLTFHNLRKRNDRYPLVHKYTNNSGIDNNVGRKDSDIFDNSEDNVNDTTINNNKQKKREIKPSKMNNNNNNKEKEKDNTDSKEEINDNKKNENGDNDNIYDEFDDDSFEEEEESNKGKGKEKINQTPNDSFDDDSFEEEEENNEDNNVNKSHITPLSSSTEDDFDENSNNVKGSDEENDNEDDKQQQYLDWINEYENNLKNSFYISKEGENNNYNNDNNNNKEFDRRKYQQFSKHFSKSKATLYTDKYDFENASNDINLSIKTEEVDKYLYYIYCKKMNKSISCNISKYKLRYKDFIDYINKLIPESIMLPRRVIKYDEKEMCEFEKRLFVKFELSRESYSSPKYIKFKKHFNIAEHMKIRECIKGCLKCIGYPAKYSEIIYDIIINMYYHNKIDEKYFKEEFEMKCIEYNEKVKENQLIDRSKECYIENKRKESLLFFMISFIFFANPGYIRYSKLKEIFQKYNIELYSNDYIYLLNFQSQFRSCLIHIIKTLPSLLLEAIKELNMKENIHICEEYISYIKTFDLIKYISNILLYKYPMLQINFEKNDKKNFLEYLSGGRSNDISFDPYQLLIKYYNLPDKYIVEEAIIYSYRWLYSKEGKWFVQLHNSGNKCSEKRSKLEMFQKCKLKQIEKMKNEIHTDNSIIKDIYYQYLLRYNGSVAKDTFDEFLDKRQKRKEIDENTEIQGLIYEIDNELLDEKISINDYLKDAESYIKEEEKEKYLNEDKVKIKKSVKRNKEKEKENKEIVKHPYLKRKIYPGISKIPKLTKRKAKKRINKVKERKEEKEQERRVDKKNRVEKESDLEEEGVLENDGYWGKDDDENDDDDENEKEEEREIDEKWREEGEGGVMDEIEEEKGDKEDDDNYNNVEEAVGKENSNINLPVELDNDDDDI